MHPSLNDWTQWDYREANRRFSAFGDALDVGEHDLLEALTLAPGLVDRFPGWWDLGPRGATIRWYDYEDLLWTLGESFRRQLKRQRALRRRPPLFAAVTELCLNPRYGKGRESFTMLLGQYGGPATAPTLVRLLADPDVEGHALYALRLLGDPGGITHAQRLLASPRTWVRREARKYLAKVERPPSGSVGA